MKFQQIRSATAIVTFGAARFLIDPWLAPKDSFPPLPGSVNPDLSCPVCELPMSISEILNVDAVIATHLHFDHFDQTAIESIPKSMPIFTQDEIDAEALKGYGFTDVRILKYCGIEFQDVTLYKIDCIHGQPGEIGIMYEKLNLPFRKEACGVVMRSKSESKTLYMAGDTIWCDYVSAAIKIYKPDIIVVNAAQATITGFGPIIMGLNDIEQVLSAAPTATVIASHMDNVGHAALWRKDIHVFVDKSNLQNRVLIPEDGEVCEF